MAKGGWEVMGTPQCYQEGLENPVVFWHPLSGAF